MDPSQYYTYDSRSRSLASTTDPRYVQSVPHYNDPAASYQSPPYQAAQPRLDYVQEGYHSSNYHSQGQMAVAPSASYPGALPPQQSSRSQPAMPGNRSVSNPIPHNHSYSAYGGSPIAGYPAPAPAPAQDHHHYARHHSPQSQSSGGILPPFGGDGGHPMQHAQQQQQYASYPHPSLHPSTTSSSHARRPHPASPVSIPPASPTSIERYACDRCEKTFSRAHDRKRHFETHHSAQPVSHKCPFCKKDFSRADSLKRHCDNGCEKDPDREGS
ncbi:hypothetical protein BXZ70DRAFT_1003216 [Cristinia sonorae]|uniref:C2H2-type domain-containing protein n=1 Tax=Cristinia sonorae TaxID=1940300 RepID=A0A8K0XUN9_9AGAR|nr:hypothetical protein BXZ70DRAFT_1003216 [Cristinia sonorae]